MTREYLTGELSVLLEKLAAATRSAAARDVANLRYQVETKPAAWLTAEMTRALALADQVCWDSLSRGDAQAFDRQAAICAELRLFGTCAGLTDEELEHAGLWAGPAGSRVEVGAGSRAELDQDSAGATEDEDAKDQPGR